MGRVKIYFKGKFFSLLLIFNKVFIKIEEICRNLKKKILVLDEMVLVIKYW